MQIITIDGVTSRETPDSLFARHARRHGGGGRVRIRRKARRAAQQGAAMTDHLFTLRIDVGRGPLVIIRAFDAPYEYSPTGHSRIDVEVTHGGRVIFPRGATWCGVPRGTTTDGIEARELVLSLVAMKPGDTDQDYFASYTPEQLAWTEEYGEAIDRERQSRYCDGNGNVRKTRRVSK